MLRLCALAAVSALLFVFVFGCAVCAHAQESDRRLPRVGVGITMSSLGAGIELATPFTRRSNIRVGFNDFVYDRDFKNDGIVYDGQLSLRSFQANYDWFPFGGRFHLSPGLLAYNGNRVKANASSSAATQAAPGVFTNPITGTARIQFRRVAPMFLAGWGNLIPRSGKHFSIPFEFGVAYHGEPRATLHMNSIACSPGNFICAMASADPTVQSGFQAEQTTIRKEVSPFKFYPVISLGFGYSF